MKNPQPAELLVSRAHPRQTDMRGDYFRDVTAIIHSTPFRRLKHKTQAFYAPKNDHICTRIEHVLHVSTISSSICRSLGLDADLAQAIALGHDLGHAPFGHEGERVLHARALPAGGFIHELHGLRVVDVLANGGKGLNLTYAVRDGIVSHCGESFDRHIKPETEAKDLESIRDLGHYPLTYEGCVVRLSDRIAYLGRDLEDAITAGFFTLSDVNPGIRKALGSSNGEIIGTLVADVCTESQGKEYVGFSAGKHDLIVELYNFNAERIYRNPKMERYRVFCKRIIEGLFDHLMALYEGSPEDSQRYSESGLALDRHFGNYLKEMEPVYEREGASDTRIVTDFVAGMTDDYAIDAIKQITIPEPVG
ncbi:MAG TPA: HD domain-containing protein [Bacillota bacterium]|nr:HD domain-containing protein [Bacillota bacterium]